MIGRADPSLLARWLRQTDMLILFLLLLFFGLGLAMMGSISPAMAQRINVDDSFFLFRHARILPVAVVFMLVISALQERTIILGSLLFALPVALVLLSLTLFFGAEVKGAQRWLVIFGSSLQPSEFLKPILIVSFGAMLSAERDVYRLPGTTMTMMLVAITTTLLWLQPDIGQSVLFMTIVYIQLFVAGTALWIIVLLPIVLLVFIGLAYVLFPHAQDRINDFFYSGGTMGYQLDQANRAIVNGGWLGEGLGMGRIKTLLPDAHSDFVLAVISEELGGIALLALLLILIIVAGISVWRSITAANLRQQIITAGLLAHLVGQTMVNLGSMLQLIPVTGMTAPFISYGGSSLIATSVSAGLLLAFNRKGQWVLSSRS